MSKKDLDNYIKDVQEGDIIDPGHLREMNIWIVKMYYLCK